MINIAAVTGLFIKLILLTLHADETSGEACSADWLDCGNGRCVAKIWLCDNDNDCGNMKDEENCEGVYHPMRCMSSQFQCKKDGYCIPETWHCDGEKDCSDESDEKNCKNETECSGFRCEDNHCIPSRWRCDGQEDCPDGSDEKFCPNTTTCKENEFRCLSGSCLNASLVCDGRKDCPDGSDEGKYCGNSCANMTCSQKCRISPNGPECYCESGYKLLKDNKTCSDIDECLIDGFCSHRCMNFAGGYECSCLDGYELVNKTCRAKGADPLLVFSTMQEIRGLYLRANHYFPIHKAIAKSAAVDADPTNQRVYWIEITNKSAIYSAKLDGSGLTKVLGSGLLIPEDIAVDYIGRNLYVTDSGLKHILVCKMEGTMCHVLHDTNTDKPRSIALDHTEGLLYWSDWGAKTAGIYRSGMDGSLRTAMVSNNISWPNGIALDRTTNRLYWTDAQLHTIEFITLDGKIRKVLIKDRVYHPYALTVFEDNLYWTDWNTYSLDSCNKFTGHKMTLMTRENGNHIMGVHVYHHVLAAKVENPCWSHTCSHMCVLAPSRTFRCVCPPSYILSSDNRTCRMDNQSPFLFISEDSNLFRVHPEMVGSDAVSVIPLKYVSAIGKVDYNRNSNVLYISDVGSSAIRSLDMTSLVPRDLVKAHVKTPEDIAFDSINFNLYWVDSTKGTVEVVSIKNLNTTVVVSSLGKPVALAIAPSKGIMFVSAIGNATVFQYDMDGKNERLMYKISGTVLSLALHPTKTLLYWSDPRAEIIASIDYLDPRSDIKMHRSRIGSVVSIALSRNYLYWTNTKHRQLYILKENSSYVYALDLPGTGDTLAARKIVYSDVTAYSATSERINCGESNGGCSHICLASSKGISCACPLGMVISNDSLTCQSGSCGTDEFRCLTSHKCISMEYRCDGTRDCEDGSDEKCEEILNRCPGDFQCRNGRCIIMSWKCDRRDDCGDNSDESDCPAPTSCKDDQFSCGGGHCIPRLWHCDGENDCKDESDEANCHETVCDDLHLRCDQGQCIPKSWVCDGQSDCIDHTDEKDCTMKSKTCDVTQFRCDDGTCIDKILICDKRSDCQDGSDEKNCSVTNSFLKCQEGRFRCHDGHCAFAHEVCDGFKDCSNGEDEWNCTIRECVHGEYQCPSSKRCIPLRYFCDGDEDCDDGADEDVNNCTKSRKIAVPLPTYPVECEEFFCYVSGKCLPWSQVCDGHKDCEDLPDEGGLCSRSCLSNNHGCAQLCRKTPSGPRCDCENGYVLMPDGKTCEDLNECLIPGRCSHYCNNTKGGFKCSCADGYFLEHDHKKCKADGGSATLVYLLPKEIRGIGLGAHAQRVYVKGANMKGMDFDVASGLFFWAAFDQGTINSISLDKSTEDILIKDPEKANIIKWDWIAKNMYYSDDNGSIKVCSQDGKYCATLIYQIAPFVDTLAISPPNGLMFWGVWGAATNKEFGFIERAELDGSHRTSLVTDRIRSPTGIAVDEIMKVIFWVDTKLNTLEYADFHGLNRKQVLAGEMNYPFSMTIFEDFVFWADWGTDTIIQCNKFTGKECMQFHKGYSKAEEMMVVHRVKQPKGTNRCANHTCPHLCLLTRGSFSCKCSDQYVARNSSCEFQTTTRPTYKPIRTSKRHCPDLYCEHNAQCTVEGTKFICRCPEGFVGRKCEIRMAGAEASHSYTWTIAVTFSILAFGVIVVFFVLCRRNREKISKVTENVSVRFRKPIFSRRSGRLVMDSDDGSNSDELMLGTNGSFKKPGFGNPLFGKNPVQTIQDAVSPEGDFKRWPSYDSEDSAFISESQTREGSQLCIDDESLENPKKSHNIFRYFKKL